MNPFSGHFLKTNSIDLIQVIESINWMADWMHCIMSVWTDELIGNQRERERERNAAAVLPVKILNQCTGRYRRNRVRVRTGFLHRGTIRSTTWRCECWRSAASSQRTNWCTSALIGLAGKHFKQNDSQFHKIITKTLKYSFNKNKESNIRENTKRISNNY